MKYTLQLFIITLATTCHGMDQQKTSMVPLKPLKTITIAKESRRPEYLNDHEIMICNPDGYEIINLIANTSSKEKIIHQLKFGSNLAHHPNKPLIALFTRSYLDVNPTPEKLKIYNRGTQIWETPQ